MSSAADTFAAGLAGLPQQGVDPGELDVIAKQAVTLASGGQLEPAIVQAVNASGLKDQLSQQHISRITELANTMTHLGQLGGEMGYPQFNVADPSKVWLSIHPDGQDPTTDDALLNAYSEPPSPEQVNGMGAVAGGGGPGAQPQEQASPEDPTKTASVKSAHIELSRIEKLYTELRDLESLRDTKTKEATAQLCTLVRRELGQGTDPSVIKTALINYAGNNPLAETVWAKVAAVVGESLPHVKLARVVDQTIYALDAHPLSQAFSRALQAEKDYMVAKVAVAKVKPGYDRALELRKQAAMASIGTSPPAAIGLPTHVAIGMAPQVGAAIGYAGGAVASAAPKASGWASSAARQLASIQDPRNPLAATTSALKQVAARLIPSHPEDAAIHSQILAHLKSLGGR